MNKISSNKINIDEIIKKLKRAIITSCDETFYFSDDLASPIDAEYLLTVNVAKSIKELNSGFGYPYKIFLEHKTIAFVNKCTPLFGNFSFIKSQHVPNNNLHINNKISRHGKIDIALYTNNNGIDIPFCAIEVKGFKPAKQNIIKDLKRNVEYFSLVSSNGKSQLPYSAFIALHSYRNTFSNEKEKANLKKVIKRYNKYLKEIDSYKGLKNNIKVFYCKVNDSRS